MRHREGAAGIAPVTCPSWALTRGRSRRPPTLERPAAASATFGLGSIQAFWGYIPDAPGWGANAVRVATWVAEARRDQSQSAISLLRNANIELRSTVPRPIPVQQRFDKMGSFSGEMARHVRR